MATSVEDSFAAMVFLFEIDHHLGPGHLGAGIERIHVGYDKIRSLCLCSALLAISNEFGKSVDWLLTGEKEK